MSHDTTLRATVAEVELDPTSTVARNVARKVATCVRTLTFIFYSVLTAPIQASYRPQRQTA